MRSILPEFDLPPKKPQKLITLRALIITKGFGTQALPFAPFLSYGWIGRLFGTVEEIAT
jgi:hypothetical protein